MITPLKRNTSFRRCLSSSIHTHTHEHMDGCLSVCSTLSPASHHGCVVSDSRTQCGIQWAPDTTLIAWSQSGDRGTSSQCQECWSSHSHLSRREAANTKQLEAPSYDSLWHSSTLRSQRLKMGDFCRSNHSAAIFSLFSGVVISLSSDNYNVNPAWPPGSLGIMHHSHTPIHHAPGIQGCK